MCDTYEILVHLLCKKLNLHNTFVRIFLIFYQNGRWSDYNKISILRDLLLVKLVLFPLQDFRPADFNLKIKSLINFILTWIYNFTQKYSYLCIDRSNNIDAAFTLTLQQLTKVRNKIKYLKYFIFSTIYKEGDVLKRLTRKILTTSFIWDTYFLKGIYTFLTIYTFCIYVNPFVF